jgi:hypothetical protein
MALTSKQKESLHEHFRNRELYDPSKVAHQEVSTFLPKTMGHSKDDDELCEGGDVKGYDEGGSVTGDDFTVDGGASDTAKDNGNPLTLATDGDQGAVAALVNKMGPPQIPPQLPPAAPPIPSTMPATPSQAGPEPMDPEEEQAANAALLAANDGSSPQQKNHAGLAPDQYDQLVAALSKGPSGGQIAASGLGALADGIMQGVARAGNPGFQKGIDERAQQQKQNLINALREKYEAGFKGQELGINQQRANDENTRAKAALKSEEARAAAERAVQLSGQQAETARAKAALGVQQGKDVSEENKNVLDQENKAGTWLGKLQGLAAPNPALVARAQGKGVSAPQVKVIGGVTYHQVGGKWYKGQ